MMKPALRMVRRLTAYLPSNNAEDAPVVPSGDAPDRLCDELRELVPVNPNVPYDIREIIELQPMSASFSRSLSASQNIVVGFIRLNGRSVGWWRISRRPRRLSRHRRVGQSGSVRPLLWRVQHSAPDAGRCAGFSAGQRSGARRDYSSWPLSCSMRTPKRRCLR